MSVIAFVPARAGSKGIKNKNLKEFCGKPVIFWVLDELEKANAVDTVIVSTDSEDIARVVLAKGLEKVRIEMRSAEAASDKATTESAMLEYLRKANLQNDDIFMLLQVTSPFTKAEHINEAANKVQKGTFDSVLSAVEFKRFTWKSDGNAMNYDYKSRPRRQDFTGDLLENGAIYAASVANVMKWENRIGERIGFVVMPDYTAVELDEESDWIVASELMKHYQPKKSEQAIKLFATDVDGVLTDTGMYYSEKGDELKKFSTLDGKGIELLRNAGVKTAIITAENTQIVANRAKKLKVDYLFQGISNKKPVLEKLCAELGISPEEIAYIGDDLNDYEALNFVGYPACPANAVGKIKNGVAGIYQTSKKGGDGAVREFADYLLATD